MPAAVELDRLLSEAVARLDFYQVMRLIENTHAELPRVGTSLRPRDDAIRLGQEAALAFAAGPLAGYDRARDGRPPRLRVNFFGLLGPNGPLPIHLTEFARDRQRNSADPTFVRFLDLFHHRMLSLFYRAWATAQPVVNRDRPQDDRFALYVGALCGLGQTSLHRRDAVPDRAKLHFAGLLSQATRHAEGLRAILQAFFRVPVEILQFVGQWLEVPADLRTRIGVRDGHARLGDSTTLGGRSWQVQHKFRVRIGPVGRADFERFLPGGDSLPRLAAWIRNYVGDTLDWDLQLVLRPDAVPALTLGGGGGGTRLGWTTWLGGDPAKRRCDQLVLDARGRN